MQNGSIGEARARAFLINRFWVLERSVDIHGADFLIQRRLTERVSLDRQRLGIVQVKHVQDGNTPISIPDRYVVDEEGHPRGEFFLLVSTGVEDSEEMYLLTAEHIVTDLKFRNGSYYGQASRIVNSRNRRIASRTLTLNAIEQSMRLVSVADNRRFVMEHGFVQAEPDQIDTDLLDPLIDWYGEVPTRFFEAKKEAEDMLMEAIDLQDALGRMILTSDPLEFSEIYDSAISDYADMRGQVMLGRQGSLLNEDLRQVSQQIRDYRKRLECKGLLTEFPAYMSRISTEVLSWARKLPLEGPYPCAHVRVEFNSSNLEISKFTISAHGERCAGMNTIPFLTRNLGPVSVTGLENGAIEICQSGPAEMTKFITPEETRDQYAHSVGIVIQSLVHHEIFGDEDGLV